MLSDLVDQNSGGDSLFNPSKFKTVRSADNTYITDKGTVFGKIIII